jgi:hypothetical protein
VTRFDVRDNKKPVVDLVNGAVNAGQVDDDDVCQIQRDASMLQKQKHIVHLNILELHPSVIEQYCLFPVRSQYNRGLCKRICKAI